MTSAQNYMLSLLKASLWGRETQQIPSSPEAWDEVIAACRKQAILETIIPVVFTIKESKPSQKQIEHLEDCYMDNLRQYQRHCQVVQSIFKAMNGAGCHPILLKGIGNSQLYPVPHYRRCGDIDVFVSGEELRKARQALTSFTPEEKMDVSEVVGEHFSTLVSGIELELHFLMGSTFDSCDIKKEMLKESTGWLNPGHFDWIEIGGEPIRVLAPSYNILHLFTHAYKHISHGLGLRHLTDIALFLHKFHGQLDHRMLQKSLERMKLLDVWQQFCDILVRYLDMKPEECPLYVAHTDSHVLWQSILDNGNFGIRRSGNEAPPPPPTPFFDHPLRRIRETYYFYYYTYLKHKALYGHRGAWLSVWQAFSARQRERLSGSATKKV